MPTIMSLFYSTIKKLREKGVFHLLLALGSVQFISFVQRVILTKYILEVEQIGQLAVLISFLNTFIVFAFLNSYLVLPRYVPRQPERKSELVSSALFISLISGLIFISGYLFITQVLDLPLILTPKNQSIFRWLIFASIGILFSNLLNQFLTSIEEIKTRAKVEFITRLSIFIAVITFGFCFQFEGVILAFGTCQLLVPITLFYWYKNRYNIRFQYNIPISTIKKCLNFSLQSTGTTIMFALTEVLDIFILENMIGSSYTIGLYATAKLFTIIFPLTAGAITESYAANISRNSEDNDYNNEGNNHNHNHSNGSKRGFTLYKKILLLILGIFIIYIIMGLLVAPYIMGFMGEKYLQSVPMFHWLIFISLFRGLSFINSLTLMYNGQIKSRSLLTFVEVITFLSCYLGFLSIYSFQGILYGGLVASIFVFVFSTFFIWRVCYSNNILPSK